MALTRLLPRPNTRVRADRGPVLARVIAFANQKGGVAKTTTTLNLGVALSEKGKRVLAVDLDPQGNLTMSQGWNPDEIERSLFDVLVHKLPITEVVQHAEALLGEGDGEIERGRRLRDAALLVRERDDPSHRRTPFRPPPALGARKQTRERHCRSPFQPT